MKPTTRLCFDAGEPLGEKPTGCPACGGALYFFPGSIWTPGRCRECGNQVPTEVSRENKYVEFNRLNLAYWVWLERGKHCQKCGVRTFPGEQKARRTALAKGDITPSEYSTPGGLTAKGAAWGVIHHIDLNPCNNRRENLLALCDPCHRELHGELKKSETDLPQSLKGEA